MAVAGSAAKAFKPQRTRAAKAESGSRRAELGSRKNSLGLMGLSLCGLGAVASLAPASLAPSGCTMRRLPRAPPRSGADARFGLTRHRVFLPAVGVCNPVAGVMGWWVESNDGRSVGGAHVRLRDVGRAPLDEGWLSEVIPPWSEIFRWPVVGSAVVGVAVAAVVFGVGRAYATCELCGCRDGENSSPDDRFFHSGNMRLNCARILLSSGLSVNSRWLIINMFKCFINRLSGRFFRSFVKITVR